MANSFLTNYVNSQKKPVQNSGGGLFDKITAFAGLSKPKPTPQQQYTSSVSQQGFIGPTKPVYAGPQQKTIPSNTSATNTKPTAITSPIKTSAGQSYVNMLQQEQQPLNQRPQGALTMDEANENNTTLQSQGDPFDEYIKSLTGASASALEASTLANSRLADIQSQNERASAEARKGYIAQLDRPGGLRGGAEQSAQVYSRRSSDDLADLALQESAAARTAGVASDAYDRAIAMGKTAYEAQQEANKPIEVGGQLFKRQPDGTYKVVAGEAKTPSISDQYGTGSIGEYNFAKSQGYKGSFNDYQNEDANRKARATGGGMGGLTPGQINTTVNSIASAFDNEPIVKSFNILNEGYQFAKSLPNTTTNPADDQGLIYAFAKAMDPGSVVREGEYATVQKYAQSWVKSFGKSVSQAIAGKGFLSEEARKNIKKTIESRYQASKTNYDNVYKEYQRQIQDAYSGTPRQITNYAGGSGSIGNSGVTPSGVKYQIIQ